MIYLRLLLISCLVSGCATFYDAAEVHEFSPQSTISLPVTALPLKITYFADLTWDAPEQNAHIFAQIAPQLAEQNIQVIPYNGQSSWLQLDVVNIRQEPRRWHLERIELAWCLLTLCSVSGKDLMLVFTLYEQEQPQQRLVLQGAINRKVSLWLLPITPFKREAPAIDNVYRSVTPFVQTALETMP